ncbi:hypothetical protein C8R44DRAFT_884976 [Mycena epipterygia]|nr:hypothetical protein C8R44DRAFT_884976 [Mycena epipterygia]
MIACLSPLCLHRPLLQTPAQYYGGFEFPTPYTLTQPLNATALAITAAVRPSGTPSLQDAGPKSLDLDSPTSSTPEVVQGGNEERNHEGDEGAEREDESFDVGRPRLDSDDDASFDGAGD